MADEDLNSLAATVLTPAAEHEWALLRELVDFADRLVVAFVFADRFPVRVIRARLQREAQESGLPFRLVVCDEPEALRNDALAAVLAPEADHEITWFEAFGTEADLRQAWHFAAQRWNEHREPLRRSFLRVLIVAAPIWAKPVIRLAAPDLWSITNLVIEPAARPAPMSVDASAPIEQHTGGTPAERVVVEWWIERLLSLPSGAQRNSDLIEALGDAVRAGAWPAAARAFDGLDLTQKAIRRWVTRAKRSGTEEISRLAARLNNLGGDLASLGLQKDALRISEVATALYREVAESRSVYLPELARSLTNLGRQLGELGRNSEAVAILREAIMINRDLSTKSKLILPALAVSLGNLRDRQFELDQMQDALSAAQESTEIFRALVDEPKIDFRLNLAMSLNNQGMVLVSLDRMQEALVATQEAVDFCRELAPANPSALNTLSASLNNLGNILRYLGRYEEALVATEESVEITTSEVRSSPQVFADFSMESLRIGIGNLKKDLKLAQKEPESSAALREAEALLASTGEATSSEEP